LPIGNSPSSHILKLPNRNFKHLPANEAIVMELDAAVAAAGDSPAAQRIVPLVRKQARRWLRELRAARR